MTQSGQEDANLEIEDAEIQSVGSNAKQYGEKLDDAMSQYLSIMDNVASEGIVSGAQHNVLGKFITAAKTLYDNGKLKTISDNVNTSCNDFVEQVDQDDQFLY